MAGGDEAFNCWNTLEDQVSDPKEPEQIWDAFEKTFKQSTSFWHFRESTANLDLLIKETVWGCQWKKETEEEQMIDLLYHATIYYEIGKYIQESEPTALRYKMVIERAKAHERNYLE